MHHCLTSFSKVARFSKKRKPPAHQLQNSKRIRKSDEMTAVDALLMLGTNSGKSADEICVAEALTSLADNEPQDDVYSITESLHSDFGNDCDNDEPITCAAQVFKVV